MIHYRKDSHVVSVDTGKIVNYVDKHSPYVGIDARHYLTNRVLSLLDEGLSTYGYRVVKGFPCNLSSESFPNMRSSNHRKVLMLVWGAACGGVK